MTLNEIKHIEQETGLKLPQCYIDVVTNYPAKLLKTDAQDFGLLNDPEVIIEENNSVRKEGYFGEEWPKQYFIVGINGCGDYYVVIIDAKKFSIGFADHEIMECNSYAENLTEFIKKYIDEQE